jgi:hypothetical protein
VHARLSASICRIALYGRQSRCFADIDDISNVRGMRQVVGREDCAMHVLTTT